MRKLLEMLLESIGKGKVVIRYSARGNVGTTTPSDELIEIAEEVKKEYESRGYSGAVAFLEDYEFDSGWGFRADEKTQTITIYNKEIELDPKTKMVRASWGYEEARIFMDTSLEDLEKARKEMLSILKKDRKYYVEECNGSEYAIGVACDALGISEEDTIDYETAVKLINEIFDYIKNDYEQESPAEQAKPVFSDPYRWREPAWEYKISTKDELKSIKITTKYLARLGAGYDLNKESITLKEEVKK